jgi:pimeloyl-ACP methyl ester carboxylesterase
VLEQKLYPIGTSQSKNLLILMPGAGNRHTSFEEHAFIRDAIDASFTADILTVDTSYEQFSDLSIETRLHAEVVLPAREAGYERIWMGGISLGGFGTMVYARKNAYMLAGLVLIAPYLGNKGTLAEVRAAGGLDAWNPDVTDEYDERHVWKLIKNYPTQFVPELPIFLLYGIDDRFVEFHQLLATRLKPEAITTMSGGHDWPVWHSLWQDFINNGPLSQFGVSSHKGSPS